MCDAPLGRLSACTVAVAPVVYFATALSDPVPEGTNATVNVTRMGTLTYNASVPKATPPTHPPHLHLGLAM